MQYHISAVGQSRQVAQTVCCCLRVMESQLLKRTLRSAYPLYSLVADRIVPDVQFPEELEVRTQHHLDSLSVEVVAAQFKRGQELPLQVVEEDIGCLG